MPSAGSSVFLGEYSTRSRSIYRRPFLSQFCRSITRTHTDATCLQMREDDQSIICRIWIQRAGLRGGLPNTRSSQRVGYLGAPAHRRTCCTSSAGVGCCSTAGSRTHQSTSIAISSFSPTLPASLRSTQFQSSLILSRSIWTRTTSSCCAPSLFLGGWRPRLFSAEFNRNYGSQRHPLTLLDPTLETGGVPRDYVFTYSNCSWGTSAAALALVAQEFG